MSGVGDESRFGLPVVGTGSMLVEAKRAGLIVAVAPVLDLMVAQGRYISGQLRSMLLDSAGETDT
jgi:uncharacterized protein